ncbi:hypothetical protein HDU98_006228 [Podochytrium sp. JEL0797]|nr:hypothetical protein HDU98_006228 [Podochytrium sp. JEL0797]
MSWSIRSWLSSPLPPSTPSPPPPPSSSSATPSSSSSPEADALDAPHEATSPGTFLAGSLAGAASLPQRPRSFGLFSATDKDSDKALTSAPPVLTRVNIVSNAQPPPSPSTPSVSPTRSAFKFRDIPTRIISSLIARTTPTPLDDDDDDDDAAPSSDAPADPASAVIPPSPLSRIALLSTAEDSASIDEDASVSLSLPGAGAPNSLVDESSDTVDDDPDEDDPSCEREEENDVESRLEAMKASSIDPPFSTSYESTTTIVEELHLVEIVDAEHLTESAPPSSVPDVVDPFLLASGSETCMVGVSDSISGEEKAAVVVLDSSDSGVSLVSSPPFVHDSLVGDVTDSVVDSKNSPLDSIADPSSSSSQEEMSVVAYRSEVVEGGFVHMMVMDDIPPEDSYDANVREPVGVADSERKVESLLEEAMMEGLTPPPLRGVEGVDAMEIETNADACVDSVGKKTGQAETVISRLFYLCPHTGRPRMPLRAFRRTRIPHLLTTLEPCTNSLGTQIPSVFSYKDFYVIYCKFWELDRDRDMRLSIYDLEMYGRRCLSHAALARVVECFGVVGEKGEEEEGEEGGKEVGKWLGYTEFIDFILSVEDKTSDSALEYWFRVLDLDGDGVLSLLELETFWEHQHMRLPEQYTVFDFFSMILDLLRPASTSVTLMDLKRNRNAAGLFLDILVDSRKHVENIRRSTDVGFRLRDEIWAAEGETSGEAAAAAAGGGEEIGLDVLLDMEGVVRRYKLEGWSKFSERAYRELSAPVESDSAEEEAEEEVVLDNSPSLQTGTMKLG